ncbi:MAG TPA: choice-of-anchor Q domain-containing protein [Armatimonadota bacterium]|jgi:hypothetical protein
MKRDHRVSLAPLAAALLLCGPASATALRVKADAPGPVRDGLSWGTAFTSVQSAVTAAQTGDEVWVAAGTYNENVVIPAATSVSLYGGFEGHENSRFERGLGPDASVLKGVSGTVLAIFAPNVTVDGFTITGGRSSGQIIIRPADAAVAQGTGAYCAGYGVVLTHNIISGNHSSGGSWMMVDTAGNGGGVFCAGDSGFIGGNVIADNIASGAGYYGFDPDNPTTGYVAAGAGVYDSGDDVTFQGNVIRGNQISLRIATDVPQGHQSSASATGGGIRVAGLRGVIRGNVITGNSLTAVDASRPGSHDFYTSGYAGGAGIFAAGALIEGNLIFANATSANGSSHGAGVYAGAGCILRNNTIADNNSHWDPTGPTTGGAVYAESGCQLANNLVAFNTGPMAFTGLVTSHNDFFGEPAAGATDIAADPLFANRAGGDYRLTAGSPCIDAGDDSVVPAGARDLDGMPRRLGAHVDIGAYEYVWVDQGLAASAAKALRIAAGLEAGADRTLDADGSGSVGIEDALTYLRRACGW